MSVRAVSAYWTSAYAEGEPCNGGCSRSALVACSPHRKSGVVRCGAVWWLSTARGAHRQRVCGMPLGAARLLAGRLRRAGRTCVERCSTRGCGCGCAGVRVCVCACWCVCVRACVCVCSPRWDCLPGYEPWEAGEAEAEGQTPCTAARELRRGQRIYGLGGRAAGGRGSGALGGYRGQITSHMYVQAWVDFVQMRQEAAHHASTSSHPRRPSPAPAPPQLPNQPATEPRPSPRPPLHAIHHGQRLHPELRALLWHGTSWPSPRVQPWPQLTMDQSGIAFAVSCSPGRPPV